MKTYILKLIDADIANERRNLGVAEEILSRTNYSDDKYWLKRKKSIEKKISNAVKYRERVLNTL